MRRFLFSLALVSLFVIAGLLLGLNGCGGGRSSGSGTSAGIQHVVVIFQENRSTDNLFHGLPNADIANTGVNSMGQVITLAPIALANHYDLDHSHYAFKRMYDRGKMDGANRVGVSCAQGARLTRSSSTWNRHRSNLTSSWRSNTHSRIACSRPTKGPVFPPTNSSLREHLFPLRPVIYLPRRILVGHPMCTKTPAAPLPLESMCI